MYKSDWIQTYRNNLYILYSLKYYDECLYFILKYFILTEVYPRTNSYLGDCSNLIYSNNCLILLNIFARIRRLNNKKDHTGFAKCYEITEGIITKSAENMIRIELLIIESRLDCLPFNSEKSLILLRHLCELYNICQESGSRSPLLISPRRHRQQRSESTNFEHYHTYFNANESRIRDVLKREKPSSGILRLLASQILCDIELYFNGYSPIKMEKIISNKDDNCKGDEIFCNRVSNPVIYSISSLNDNVMKYCDISKEFIAYKLKINHYVMYFSNETDIFSQYYIDLDSIITVKYLENNQMNIIYNEGYEDSEALLKFINNDDYNYIKKIINQFLHIDEKHHSYDISEKYDKNKNYKIIDDPEERLNELLSLSKFMTVASYSRSKILFSISLNVEDKTLLEQILFESYISIIYSNVKSFNEPPHFSSHLALLIYTYFAEVLENNNKYILSLGIYEVALSCTKIQGNIEKYNNLISKLACLSFTNNDYSNSMDYHKLLLQQYKLNNVTLNNEVLYVSDMLCRLYFITGKYPYGIDLLEDEYKIMLKNDIQSNYEKMLYLLCYYTKEACMFSKAIYYGNKLMNITNKLSRKKYCCVLFMLADIYYDMRDKSQSELYVSLLSNQIYHLPDNYLYKEKYIYHSLIPNLLSYYKLNIKIQLLNNHYLTSLKYCISLLSGEIFFEKDARIVARLHWLLAKTYEKAYKSDKITYPIHIQVSNIAFTYESNDELLCESIHQYKIASKIYNIINDSYHYGKMLNHIIDVYLSYVFVQVTYQNIPIEKASLISFPSYTINCAYSIGNILSLSNEEIKIQAIPSNSSLSVNSESSEDNSSFQKSLMSISDILSMLNDSFSVFEVLSEPIELLISYLNKIEYFYIKKDYTKGNELFIESYNLFLLLFVEGIYVPLVSTGSNSLVEKIYNIVKRFVRILFLTKNDNINKNLLLLDIYLMLQIDIQCRNINPSSELYKTGLNHTLFYYPLPWSYSASFETHIKATHSDQYFHDLFDSEQTTINSVKQLFMNNSVTTQVKKTIPPEQTKTKLDDTLVYGIMYQIKQYLNIYSNGDKLIESQNAIKNALINLKRYNNVKRKNSKECTADDYKYNNIVKKVSDKNGDVLVNRLKCLTYIIDIDDLIILYSPENNEKRIFKIFNKNNNRIEILGSISNINDEIISLKHNALIFMNEINKSCYISSLIININKLPDEYDYYICIFKYENNMAIIKEEYKLEINHLITQYQQFISFNPNIKISENSIIGIINKKGPLNISSYKNITTKYYVSDIKNNDKFKLEKLHNFECDINLIITNENNIINYSYMDNNSLNFINSLYKNKDWNNIYNTIEEITVFRNNVYPYSDKLLNQNTIISSGISLYDLSKRKSSFFSSCENSNDNSYYNEISDPNVLVISRNLMFLPWEILINMDNCYRMTSLSMLLFSYKGISAKLPLYCLFKPYENDISLNIEFTYHKPLPNKDYLEEFDNYIKQCEYYGKKYKYIRMVENNDYFTNPSKILSIYSNMNSIFIFIYRLL